LRPPGLDKGEKDNENIVLLLEHHFCSLHLNLQNAEIILEAFPEAVKEQLSHIKSHQYNKNTEIGLETNHPDWKDHGHGLITYKHHIYIPPEG